MMVSESDLNRDFRLINEMLMTMTKMTTTVMMVMIDIIVIIIIAIVTLWWEGLYDDFYDDSFGEDKITTLWWLH